jgi:acyl-CoA synthetase (AMP-forming)/AMP-acid ligase II
LQAEEVDWANMTIPAMLERSTRDFADREALIAGSTRLTYRQLLDEVRRVANALIDLRVSPGQMVGIWLPNVAQWPVVNLAAASIGAITVPINTRFREREAHYVLASSEVTVLFTTHKFLSNSYLDMLENIAPDLGRDWTRIRSDYLPALRCVITLDDPTSRTLSWEAFVEGSTSQVTPELRDRLAELRSDAPVTMFWTSGTTANPKGALAPHRVVENIAHYARLLHYRPEDRCLASAPLFYTTTNYWVLLVALMTGACCVLQQYLTPDETLELLERERISVMIGMPSIFISLLAHPNFPTVPPEAVRCAWLGGAAVSERFLGELKEKLGLENLYQVYGMTETGGITTLTKGSAQLAAIAGSVGRPLPNFELRIVNQAQEDVSFDEVGELWVKSPYNLVTYYGMSSEQLSVVFASDGWFKTGDQLSKDREGNYHFEGRLKDVIKVGGENVAAQEVESVLLSHPAVVQTAVVGVPDPHRSEAVIAFVQTTVPVDEEDLREFCRQRLAPFKRPQRVLFRGDWPLTATGKIQKYVLRDAYLEMIGA